MKIYADEILEIVAKEKGINPSELELVLDHNEMQFYIETIRKVPEDIFKIEFDESLEKGEFCFKKN